VRANKRVNGFLKTDLAYGHEQVNGGKSSISVGHRSAVLRKDFQSPVKTSGEYLANVLSCPAVGVRRCLVSVKDTRGIRHTAEVQADSLYEAATLGFCALRKDDWSEELGPGTQLEVCVYGPAITHTVTVNQILRWCDGVAVNPDEVLKVKELLDA
jgi:hypothetical protein